VTNGLVPDLGALEAGADLSGFAQWLFGWFGSGSSATEDLDHDGANNLMEFALGLDPATHNSSWLPAVTRPSGKLLMTVARDPDAADVQFSVEVSGDLVNWQSGAPHTTTLQNSVTTLQVQDEGSGTRRFIRLRVTK
jgi:hypothetical protein